MFFGRNKSRDAAPTASSFTPTTPVSPTPAPAPAAAPEKRELQQQATLARMKILVVSTSLYPRLFMSIITADPDASSETEGAEMLVNGYIDVDRSNGLAFVEPGDKLDVKLTNSGSGWYISRASLSTSVEEEKARLEQRAKSTGQNAAGALPPRHQLRTPR